MIHLSGNHNTYTSKDVIGFVDKIKDEGIIDNKLDLVMLGFSLAIKKGYMPAEDFNRHDLGRVYVLGENQILYEAMAQDYAEEINFEIESDSGLLNFICKLGITGVRDLKERWDGKRKAQIQYDILNLIQD